MDRMQIVMDDVDGRRVCELVPVVIGSDNPDSTAHYPPDYDSLWRRLEEFARTVDANRPTLDDLRERRAGLLMQDLDTEQAA